jgi:hypothetical protein
MGTEARVRDPKNTGDSVSMSSYRCAVCGERHEGPPQAYGTRPSGERPYAELEPTDHLLAVERRNGVPKARLEELASLLLHEAEQSPRTLDRPL